MLIQNTGRVAEQGIGQGVRPDTAGELVRAGAHHQRKAAVLQGCVCIGVAAGKGAGDGVAEVCHKHQHQRRALRKQVAEAVLRAVRCIVQKEGELVPDVNPIRHGQTPLSQKL